MAFLGFADVNLQQSAKTSVMNKQGESLLFPGAAGWVWAASQQPMSGDIPDCCHPHCTSQEQRSAAQGTGECFAFCHAEFSPLKGA